MLIPEGNDALISKFIRHQEIITSSFRIPSSIYVSPAISQLIKKLEDDSKKFEAMFKSLNISILFEELNKGKPTNYRGLMINEQFRVIELSQRGNFGTVEIMPIEVLRLLLACDGSIFELNRIILDHENDILQSANKIVDDAFELLTVEDYPILLSKSVNAFIDGHFEASQTLSTTLWDTFICKKAGHFKPITEIKPLAKKPNIDDLETFAPLYDYGAFGPALSSYVTNVSSDKYSRHGSVHQISTRSLNKLNSIKALSIAAGLIGRNLQP